MCAKSGTRGIDVAIVVLSIVVIACAVWFGYYLGRLSVAADLEKAVGEAASKMQGIASESNSAAQAVQERVFDGDAARVTYRGMTEPTEGDAMFNFALENKFGKAVVVGAENVIVNGEHSVEMLGGSIAPIAPGTTGSVSIMFGYSVQTSLQSIDEIKTVSCDLVMRDDNAPTEVVGSVPVTVEV